jgi:hypothetical protein
MALRCTHIKMADEPNLDPGRGIFSDKGGGPREGEESASPPQAKKLLFEIY